MCRDTPLVRLTIAAPPAQITLLAASRTGDKTLCFGKTASTGHDDLNARGSRRGNGLAAALQHFFAVIEQCPIQIDRNQPSYTALQAGMHGRKVGHRRDRPALFHAQGCHCVAKTRQMQ